MTHHTDAEQERASLGAFIDRAGRDGFDTAHTFFDCGEVVFLNPDTADLWDFWQAARRAPAAPVPQWGKVGTCEWFDGYADHTDGCGPYKERVLYTAPQLPEAAPVPQFSRIAQKKLDYLLEAGEVITGYAIENKDGRRGAIDCHGFVYWWQDAAAPQPPEVAQSNSAEFDGVKTKVAPVQLPEPVAYVHTPKLIWNGKIRPVVSFEKYEDDYQAGIYSLRIPLYTEQQVRDLLAAHGIGKDKA